MSVLGFKGEKFKHVHYFKHGGSGDSSGSSEDNAAPMVTKDLFTIPDYVLIEKAYVLVDVAITGTTAIDVGDDDDADGYVPAASITLGTPGVYGWDAKNAGAYMRIQTAGATDAADIYVVPNAKYYADVTAKELKVAFTTDSTAGRLRVVVEGTYIGR